MQTATVAKVTVCESTWRGYGLHTIPIPWVQSELPPAARWTQASSGELSVFMIMFPLPHRRETLLEHLKKGGIL